MANSNCVQRVFQANYIFYTQMALATNLFGNHLSIMEILSKFAFTHNSIKQDDYLSFKKPTNAKPFATRMFTYGPNHIENIRNY